MIFHLATASFLCEIPIIPDWLLRVYCNPFQGLGPWAQYFIFYGNVEQKSHLSKKKHDFQSTFVLVLDIPHKKLVTIAYNSRNQRQSKELLHNKQMTD